MSQEQSDISEVEVDRVQVSRKTVEYHRPTVEVEGHPLSEGFPVQKLTLDILDGPDKGQSKTFEKPVIRLGADPLCDIVLTDPTVSRMHAEVRRKGGDEGMELVDLDSTNGTFIDGISVGRVAIKPGSTFQVGRTQVRISSRTEQVSIEVTDRTRYGNIVGRSSALREIFSIMDRVAPSDLSVVIEGETGTGKELIAQAIHEQSNRKDKPFVVFDCSAFPATLLESELFGHEKGAFSGAMNRHRGVFERADGGTIFFDELGEMDIEFQSKFLRVLETGEVRRVGGEKTFEVDVRVVAATNRNLEDLVEEKKFRQDLFYRLAKVRFNLPPLRERVEDVPLLAEHFLDQMAGDDAAKPLITEDAVRTLQAYQWPGNIRQLKNVVEKAVAMCGGGTVSAEYLAEELGLTESSSSPTAVRSSAPPIRGDNTGNQAVVMTPILDGEGTMVAFREAKDTIVADFEKQYLERLVDKNEGNISAAAREAEVDRRHLYRLLKKHDLMDK
jgi:transcriptional regulator with GAF, ATPase, and Fis domain